jgi:hypothetical protein
MKKSKGYFTSLFEGKTKVGRADDTLNIRDGKAFQLQNSVCPITQRRADRVDTDNTASTRDCPTAYPTDFQEDEYNTCKTGESTLSTSVYPCNVKYNAYLETLNEFVSTKYPDALNDFELIIYGKSS